MGQSLPVELVIDDNIEIQNTNLVSFSSVKAEGGMVLDCRHYGYSTCSCAKWVMTR